MQFYSNVGKFYVGCCDRGRNVATLSARVAVGKAFDSFVPAELERLRSESANASLRHVGTRPLRRDGDAKAIVCLPFESERYSSVWGGVADGELRVFALKPDSYRRARLTSSRLPISKEKFSGIAWRTAAALSRLGQSFFRPSRLSSSTVGALEKLPFAGLHSVVGTVWPKAESGWRQASQAGSAPTRQENFCFNALTDRLS
jgi:hypothetical protein